MAIEWKKSSTLFSSSHQHVQEQRSKRKSWTYPNILLFYLCSDEKEVAFVKELIETTFVQFLRRKLFMFCRWFLFSEILFF